MRDREQPPRDDADGQQLDELLALVDGPRGLSSDAEDRLLRDILRTAAQPRASEELDVAAAAAVELATRRTRTWPRGVAVAVAAGAVAAVVGVVVLTPDPPPVVVEPIGDGQPFVVDLDADGATLCNAIAIQVARARINADDVNVDGADAPLPLDLARLLEELDARLAATDGTSSVDETDVAQLRAAAVALRLQAALQEEGDAAGAARSRQRAVALLTPLLPLDATFGCPPPDGT